MSMFKVCLLFPASRPNSGVSENRNIFLAFIMRTHALKFPFV